jgi:hypothetical protein
MAVVRGSGDAGRLGFLQQIAAKARGSTAQWARVCGTAVPLMRELAGFGGYYLLNGGPDELIAISLFDSADETLISNEKAVDWVRNNVPVSARDTGGHGG